MVISLFKRKAKQCIYPRAAIFTLIFMSGCGPKLTDISQYDSDHVGRVYRSKNDFILLSDKDNGFTKYQIDVFGPSERALYPEGIPKSYQDSKVIGLLPKGTSFVITHMIKSSGSDVGDCVFPIVRIENRGPFFGMEAEVVPPQRFLNGTTAEQADHTDHKS